MGMIISVASTMVLSRLLIDSGQLQSQHGKVMIGITLVEDLVVVVLTILMPALVSLTPHHLLGIAMALGKAALILAPIGFLRCVPGAAWLARVADRRINELFLLVILAICLGTAALTEAVGLSLALGAFAAGLIISASDYAHRALEQLLPLRDAFVALFFVTVGILINPRAVIAQPGLLAGDSRAGRDRQVRGVDRRGQVVWLSAEDGDVSGIGLTQIGEFSFILVQVAHGNGLVGDEFYSATLAVSLVSILINARMVKSVPTWLQAPKVVQARR